MNWSKELGSREGDWKKVKRKRMAGSIRRFYEGEDRFEVYGHKLGK